MMPTTAVRLEAVIRRAHRYARAELVRMNLIMIDASASAGRRVAARERAVAACEVLIERPSYWMEAAS